MTSPVLDIVIPVHHEEHTVAACVRRLHQHLVQTFPYPFRITVADNASTDATSAVASGLVVELPGVVLVQLPCKGRGRALKEAWLASDAPILAYLILRGALGVRFSDAQCGFKAIRADVAAELLPLVEDTTWFFDTELLVLAERSGLRIHEVPVDWFDDPDSRVDVVRTARDDLRGVWRVRRGLWAGTLPVDEIASRIGRCPHRAGPTRQVGRFATVGAVSTVVHLGSFALLRTSLDSSQLANLVALLGATVVNTALNRRWTFGIRGGGSLRHQAQGLVLFAATWGLTAGALGLLHLVMSSPGTVLATDVVAGGTAASTVVRFVAMRSWMFRSPAQYSRTTNLPSVSSNTTMPVQSKVDTDPRHTATSP